MADALDAHVRLASRADLPEIAVVHRDARRAAVMPDPADDVEAWVTGWDLDESDVWVVDVDERVAAYARMQGAWLDDLYVAPAHQGRGIGSLLLEVVCSLRPHGFGLWVFATNWRARSFYRRHGLVELELTDGSSNAEHEPDVRVVWPGEHPERHLSEALDDVDDELGLLLARRFALDAALRDVAGPPGPARDARSLDRMARLAPGVDPDRLARVMTVLGDEGAAAWERGAVTERP